MNTPAFDPDDPRLTAYALGESSPAEREAVERLLVASPEAREEVERTAALGRALETAYRQENESYWDDRATRPSAGKVIEFSTARRAAWKPTIALAWKIAAMVVVFGALAPLALRRAPWQRTVALETPPPNGVHPPSPAAAPAPVDAAPAAGSVAQTNVPADADRDQSPPLAPGTIATTPDTADSLAMNTDRARTEDSAGAGSATLPAAPMPDSNAEAKPSVRRSKETAAPAAVATDEPAAKSGGSVISLADRIGRSLVRIRITDGTIVGGVAVTADGGILAAQPLPATETRPTVILADGREIPATLARDGAGPRALHLEGAHPNAVALATSAPADKSALTVASTDRHTGATRLTAGQAIISDAEVRLRWPGRLPSDDETNLVFNLNGELLYEADAPPIARSVARTRSAPGRPSQTEPILRPFTAAERALLQPAVREKTR